MRHIRLKTFIRNQAIGILKDSSEDTETRKWTDLLTLKLFYALIFTAVVERVYVKCAITTLSAMSVDRAEQFTLSLLIHYPQYLLWGVMAAIIALIAVNLLVCSWLCLATYLCCKLNRADIPAGKDTQAVEVPND
ncbi:MULTISPECIES: hypothetical protein [Enterobacteriaceae]|uniref:Uncharacterized protein n=1 Tax=Enterobacter cloacae TaxID=550 RepID=A0AA42QZ09_ENTCL|nr:MULTISPECIES: hypothetical protein [Enterobacteriaceae]HAS0831037.1 hypothetical protein [Enterobacter cloacae subsp. cloacae]EKY1504214.1 hypothetical protein [Enterobacter cloacae]ELJ5855425.1 hypothetical protein [Enterobacter kobei]KYC19137.1 hypothetical protein WM45_14070 [Citrobacter sp. AATXR]MBH0128652.1 hypothetical protein [Enterobacter sp. SECR18-0236]